MSIIKSINQLVVDIQTKCAVNCGFGNKDLGAEDYPYVKVIPDSSFNIGGTYDSVINYDVTLKIIVAKDNELDGLEVLEKLICALSDLSRCAGHSIGGDGNSTYTANTYEITIPFTLKTIQIPRS